MYLGKWRKYYRASVGGWGEQKRSEKQQREDQSDERRKRNNNNSVAECVGAGGGRSTEMQRETATSCNAPHDVG